MQDKNTCCNQDCNQGRECPVRANQAAPAAVAMADERAAFEATNIAGRYYRSPEPGHADEYADSHTQLAWKSWQARAALAATQASDAPAVVAVQLDANGIAPCPLCGSESKHVKADVGGHRILCWNDDCECSSGYFCSKEEAITSWNYRAALAATPAQSVVLPELDAAVREVMDLADYVASLAIVVGIDIAEGEEELEKSDRALMQKASDSLESKLRALLATATGLPAQAVAYIDSEVLTSFLSSSNYRPEDGWDCHIRHQENKRDTDVPLYSRPQAQADARDAELLGFLQDQCIDLRCFTTSDGEDVGWRTVQHHMGKPHERVVSEVCSDDPRRAIREAMARIERDPYCTGPLHLEDDAAIAAAKGE